MAEELSTSFNLTKVAEDGDLVKEFLDLGKILKRGFTTVVTFRYWHGIAFVKLDDEFDAVYIPFIPLHNYEYGTAKPGQYVQCAESFRLWYTTTVMLEKNPEMIHYEETKAALFFKTLRDNNVKLEVVGAPIHSPYMGGLPTW